MKIDWKALLERLDYHHGKWYEHRIYGWQLIHKEAANSILMDLAPDEDYERIRRMFSYRDKESHARSRDTKREHQIPLGDWV